MKFKSETKVTTTKTAPPRSKNRLKVFGEIDDANKWLAENDVTVVALSTMVRPGGHFWFESFSGTGPYILIAYTEN